MQITLQCYGQLQALSGAFEHPMEIADRATVAEALAVFTEQCPAITNALPRAACAVGDEIVRRQAVLAENTTLVLLPPVGGG